MKYLFFLLFIIFSTTALISQEAISGGDELLKKLNSFPEEYVNKTIIFENIWVRCEAEKILKSNYYSIYLYKESNELNTISAHDSNVNSVITKKLAKSIIKDDNIDTENKKYLANVYGKVKKGIFWYAEYTFIIDKIEFKAWDRMIMKVIE